VFWRSEVAKRAPHLEVRTLKRGVVALLRHRPALPGQALGERAGIGQGPIHPSYRQTRLDRLKLFHPRERVVERRLDILPVQIQLAQRIRIDDPHQPVEDRCRS